MKGTHMSATTTKTITFEDGTEVEAKVQTQVCFVTPSGIAVESSDSGLILMMKTRKGYLKVVSEWICPRCCSIHGDQTSPICEGP